MTSPHASAAALGALQGLTEFLPVSSDGHLALAEILFGLETAGLTFNVLLHAGTLAATAIVLRERLWRALREGLGALLKPSRFRETSGGRDALVIVIASLPTALIGLGLRDAVARWTSDPLVIGLGFLATTVVLVLSGLARRGEAEQPSLLGAVAIGIAQGFAVLPGLSRSGSTIATALWLGVRPDRAFELSMLMSLPAVAGALALEAPKALAHGSLDTTAWLGAAAALLVGVAALLLLQRLVKRGRFMWFALWVGPLAVATIAMGLAWPARH
jgi:undecaprenyl-diphosphatase